MAGKRTIVAAVVPPAAPKPVRKRKHVSASHQATIAAQAIAPTPGAQAKPAPPPSARPTVLPPQTGARAPRKQHLATIAAQVVPPARELPSARVTDVETARPPSGLATMVATTAKPSQQNTMAAPIVPSPGGVKKHAFGLQATMIATGAPDEVADEIHIDLGDSVIAKVPEGLPRETSVRIKVRTPTFDNLAVIAPRRWPWWYAAGAAAAAVIIVLLIAIP